MLLRPSVICNWDELQSATRDVQVPGFDVGGLRTVFYYNFKDKKNEPRFAEFVYALYGVKQENGSSSP